MRKLNIIGTDISATNYEEVVNAAGNWLSQAALGVEKGAKYICLTSVHGIVTARRDPELRDRKSTRLNSSHVAISYAVFCLKKKKPTSPTIHGIPYRPQIPPDRVREWPRFLTIYPSPHPTTPRSQVATSHANLMQSPHAYRL